MSQSNLEHNAFADETIVGIYHFFQPRSHEGAPPQYYLLHVLDHRGMLDREIVVKVYKDKFQKEMEREQDIVGPFESLDELNMYAYEIAQVINAPKVSLLSVSEYNLLLESAMDLNSLIFDLKNKGNILENIEKDQVKKSGFFSKIFK